MDSLHVPEQHPHLYCSQLLQERVAKQLLVFQFITQYFILSWKIPSMFSFTISLCKIVSEIVGIVSRIKISLKVCRRRDQFSQPRILSSSLPIRSFCVHESTTTAFFAIKRCTSHFPMVANYVSADICLWKSIILRRTVHLCCCYRGSPRAFFIEE